MTQAATQAALVRPLVAAALCAAIGLEREYHQKPAGLDPNTAMWLRDAVGEARLPRIDQLGDPRSFPYRYGKALWAYLSTRFGEDVVAKAKSPYSFPNAIATRSTCFASMPLSDQRSFVRRAVPTSRACS